MTDISTQTETTTNDTKAKAKDDAIVIDLTPIPVTVTRTPCMCGCGEMPQRESARFIPGHDAKLKSTLVQAHLAGVEVIRLTDASGTRELSPMEWAEELDWDGFLVVAQRKRDRDEAAKAARKAEKSA